MERALVASVVVVVVAVASTSASAASTASDMVRQRSVRYNQQIRAARRIALDCLYAAPCEALRPVLKGTNLWIQ